MERGEHTSVIDYRLCESEEAEEYECTDCAYYSDCQEEIAHTAEERQVTILDGLTIR